jgi:hypothetical protein
MLIEDIRAGNLSLESVDRGEIEQVGEENEEAELCEASVFLLLEANSCVSFRFALRLLSSQLATPCEESILQLLL